MSVNGALLRHIYPQAKLGQGIGFNAMVVSASSAIGPTVAAGHPGAGTLAVAVRGQHPDRAGGAGGRAGRALPLNQLSGAPVRLAVGGAQRLHLRPGVQRRRHPDPHPRAGCSARSRRWRACWSARCWCVRELARPRPLVPVDLLRNPIFALSVATSIASFSRPDAGLRRPAVPLREHACTTPGGDRPAADAMAGGRGADGAGRRLAGGPDVDRGAVRDRAWRCSAPAWRRWRCMPAAPTPLDIGWRMARAGSASACSSRPTTA